MKQKQSGPSALAWIGGTVAAAAAGYGLYAGYTWLRFGHMRSPRPEEADNLLETFMPTYDVVERHHVHVEAPPEMTLAAAEEQDLSGSLAVRGILWLRQVVMGAKPGARELPKGLIREVEGLGWGVLARIPGREVVVGAVTRPWEPNVTFRAIPAAEFAAFHDPDYVKIVWTLRADPVGSSRSIFRTETRAVATDDAARAKFRRYWSCVAPGVDLMRRLSLGPVKRDAERRVLESVEVAV